jgi:hypothetical protein
MIPADNLEPSPEVPAASPHEIEFCLEAVAARDVPDDELLVRFEETIVRLDCALTRFGEGMLMAQSARSEAVRMRDLLRRRIAR